MKTLAELINNIDAIESRGDLSIIIKSICYDSRKCVPGSMFVAFKGVVSDGHAHIKSAVEKGAVAVIFEDASYEGDIPPGVAAIRVKASRNALAIVSHNFFGNPCEKMRVVGVTGTNGKTTITYLLKAIYEAAGRKTGIIGTTGIFYGDVAIEATHTTPESLELAGHFANMLADGVDTVVIEASSHALHQSRTDGIKFDAALFTNLTHEHLDYHKTPADYAAAKRILFETIDEHGVAIAFDNSEFTEFILSGAKTARKYKIGRGANLDFTISNELLGLDFSSFDITTREGRVYQIRTPLIGAFNIDNAAVAFSAATETGVSAKTAIESLARCTGAPGRMERITLNNGAAAFVDYAHTPDALEKALTSAREVLNDNSKGALISVFGCGGDRDRTKRPKMGEISAKLADISIITDDNPRTEESEAIISEIMTGVTGDLIAKIEIIPNRREAIQRAVALSRKGDVILVAGKGHENYQIIGKEKFHFDDREELRQ